MLIDLGCGSGLSLAAPALRQAGHVWLGVDVSSEMLRIAAHQPGCSGLIALTDFGHGLPLRASIIDGVISVSAVQASHSCAVWAMHAWYCLEAINQCNAQAGVLQCLLDHGALVRCLFEPWLTCSGCAVPPTQVPPLLGCLPACHAASGRARARRSKCT